MPTFRNDGERAVIYNETDGKNIIIFDSGVNVQLVHWIPYRRLGLTLVNETYPPVPNTVLISGEFKFSRGMERKFDIGECRKYELEITPDDGILALYVGASRRGKIISKSKYTEILDWQYAPYIRVTGEGNANIQATLKE